MEPGQRVGTPARDVRSPAHLLHLALPMLRQLVKFLARRHHYHDGVRPKCGDDAVLRRDLRQVFLGKLQVGRVGKIDKFVFEILRVLKKQQRVVARAHELLARDPPGAELENSLAIFGRLSDQRHGKSFVNGAIFARRCRAVSGQAPFAVDHFFSSLHFRFSNVLRPEPTSNASKSVGFFSEYFW
ncbi:MAG: hypothetical protein DLM52_13465 [Chthoniobacterales bacterium]|nr:MAG: hypothetical protein DLM52_13465 [Chthoniobacterales bacterium]